MKITTISRYTDDDCVEVLNSLADGEGASFEDEDDTIVHVVRLFSDEFLVLSRSCFDTYTSAEEVVHWYDLEKHVGKIVELSVTVE